MPAVAAGGITYSAVFASAAPTFVAAGPCWAGKAFQSVAGTFAEVVPSVPSHARFEQVHLEQLPQFLVAFH